MPRVELKQIAWYVGSRGLLYALSSLPYVLIIRWADGPGWAMLLAVFIAIAHLNLVNLIGSLRNEIRANL